MTELLFVVAIASIILAVGIMLALIAWKKRNEDQLDEPNYRTLFIMGIIWFPTGIFFLVIYIILDLSFVIGLPLSAMGLIYLIVGLVNRDKWNKKE